MPQVRWALEGLQALQPRWAAPSAAAAALRQETLHFVAGLHAWSLHALLDTAWHQLHQVPPFQTSQRRSTKLEIYIV